MVRPSRRRDAPHLLERRLRPARRLLAERTDGHSSRPWPARPGSARDDRDGAPRATVAGPPRPARATWWRSPASSSGRRSSAPATSTRQRPSRFPGSRACCRASGSSIHSTGGSASSCATPRPRTGRGPRNGPATFGHFGGAGTFIWVDPVLDVALVCLTDRDYGPWALDGLAGAERRAHRGPGGLTEPGWPAHAAMARSMARPSSQAAASSAARRVASAASNGQHRPAPSRSTRDAR